MKKIFLLIVITLISLPGFAQWTTTGNNLTTDKNVGIGKNPQYKLDIDGTVASKNLKINFNEYIGSNMTDVFNYKGRNMGHYALSWGTDSWANDGASLWQSGYGGIKFFTYGKCRMAINKAGNVGIGTDDPTYKLDVNGNARFGDLTLLPSSTSNGWKNTNLYYSGHSLRIGPVKGGWANTQIEIVPGSSIYENCNSSLLLYYTNTSEEYLKKVQIFANGNSYFNGGNVGIGTDNPKYKLDVKGNIRATEIKIEDISSWSDFVFEKDYQLPSLSEVESHIETHKHLPDVPSEAQVKKEGVNVVEMQSKLLQKIEELTLYVIKQDKEIQSQNKEIQNLKKILQSK